jgi:hypothetical protein
VLDPNTLDPEEIANALADRTDYEHRWLINPQTGEIASWAADTGIDGQTPVDLDELDLVCIDPPQSYISNLPSGEISGDCLLRPQRKIQSRQILIKVAGNLKDGHAHHTNAAPWTSPRTPAAIAHSSDPVSLFIGLVRTCRERMVQPARLAGGWAPAAARRLERPGRG